MRITHLLSILAWKHAENLAAFYLLIFTETYVTSTNSNRLNSSCGYPLQRAGRPRVGTYNQSINKRRSNATGDQFVELLNDGYLSQMKNSFLAQMNDFSKLKLVQKFINSKSGLHNYISRDWIKFSLIFLSDFIPSPQITNFIYDFFNYFGWNQYCRVCYAKKMIIHYNLLINEIVV